MAEDPNVVPKSAVLQSITTEASGFYGLIVTVASTFLGGSLFFLDKIAPVQLGWSILILISGWSLLVGAIGFTARVRYLNLRSGRLALREEYDAADLIDRKTDRLSNVAQWCLVLGMVALMIIGCLNFNSMKSRERNSMENTNSMSNDRLEKSIPYGSLKPMQSATPPQSSRPSNPQPQQPSQPQN